MSLFVQALFAIAIIAAFFAVLLKLRGQTMAARRATQRAVIVMAGSALLGGLLQMYASRHTP